MEEEAGSLHPFPGGCRGGSRLLLAVALEALRKDGRFPTHPPQPR